MKGLAQFRRFDYMAFARDKRFCVTGLREWQDFQTKAHLGWKVETSIVHDGTEYAAKEGQVISNLYQPLTFKCVDKPTVAVGDLVVPTGDVVCVVYGQYNNMLSVRCDSMQVVTPTAGKEKN